jgi:hypothetical protein
MLRHHSCVVLTLLLLGVSVVLAESFTTTQRHSHSMQQTATMSTTTTMAPSVLVVARGGESASSSPTSLRAAADPSESSSASSSSSQGPFSKGVTIFGSLWGSLGVVYILAKAVKRVLPIALEPITGSLLLTPIQWSCYAASCLFFAYAEGYKGFQCKFSPLVVKRSFSLVMGTPQGNNVLNYVLAPLYSMGLMNATKKRMIVSWSVSMGVTALVVVVKRLPGVWRCILDAGVVVGLTYGSASILWLFLKAIVTGQAPNVDACLPEAANTTGSSKPKSN